MPYDCSVPILVKKTNVNELTFFFFVENFHHLYDLLSQLKITVLDGARKDAKQKYNDALKAYVTQYFGRPLEKLNVCF